MLYAATTEDVVAAYSIDFHHALKERPLCQKRKRDQYRAAVMYAGEKHI
jgi:hypothetical protein